MKNTTLASASILMLIGTILVAAVNSPPANGASTGTICMIPSGASSCPSSPASITGTVGTQVRVPIFIQNSTALNGFDITLLADHTILRPAGADLTGSVLPGPQTVLLKCLSGILVTGPTCSSTDTVDTLHFVASSALGTITTTPTTGLLFTAVYNVTQATSGTSLGFQTGCGSPSAPTSHPPTCVTVANGTPTPVPEAIQTAVFSTSTTPDFAMTSSPNSLTLPAGASATSTIAVISSNGFTGTVVLSTSISPSGPVVSLSASSVTLSPGGGGTSTLTVSTTSSTAAGSYTIMVTGVSGALSHVTGILVTVNAVSKPNFSIVSTDSSIGISQGLTAIDSIVLTSLGGFTGTVSLTDSVSPAGLVLNLNPTSVTLTSGGTGNSTLTISTASSLPGSYNITVTGTSGSISHAVTIPVIVFSSQLDFTIAANPSSLSFAAGTSGTSTISLHGVNGFNSTVFLTVSASSGLTAAINPTSIGPLGTATLTVTSTTPGSYTAQVTGTSGSLSHTTSVSVTVGSNTIGIVCIVPSGATSCPSSPASISGQSGTQVRISVFIQGSAGLLGFDVTLLADHTILKPAKIDLTGSVLIGNPVIVVECIAGTLVSGSTCSASDTVDTIHLAATSALGSPLTNSPITGLLFTAIYNVTGTTSGIPLAFQSGCSNTSVSPNICVTIANGSPNSVPETVQTAIFSNSAPVPDFTITASPTSLTLARGSCDASSTVTLTSIGSFSGTIALTTTVSPAGPTTTLSSATATLSPGGTATIALTVCTTALTPSGSYTIGVTATSGSITHIATMILIVPSQAYSISAVPSGLTIRRGSTNSSIGSSTLTIVSSGFTGTISISASITPTAPHSPTVKLSSTSVTLSSGGTAQVFLTVAAGKNTSVGSYTVTVTFASGSTTQTVAIMVTVVR